MSQSRRKSLRNYDGTEVTSHHLSELLQVVLSQVGEKRQENAPAVLAAWADLIGPKLAPMTEAYSFIDGILGVKVKNSTLYSLLCQHEKVRLLQLLRKKFPHTSIKNIHFRIG